ncbi:sporulation protein [Flavobacterium terrae]|nr:sporulation protein [Flavobacterium terrae]
MKTLTIKNLFYISILAIFNSLNIYSQEGKVTVNQDQRFEQLLNEKRKINNSITINDRFKIQIFTGNAELSKKALIDFRKSNKKTDATIVFHTPIYKVWVGNYKTRIEAEKKLMEFKKKYPNAFLVKPNK